MKKIKHLKAFTLIEMLLVLLIISLLLVLIIPNISKQSKHIQSTGCKAQLKLVDSQIQAYTLKFGQSPDNIDNLVSEGFIKDEQKSCKNGQTISITNGEAVAS
ncbi:competence type IV pilus major pilin ComGC [Staphylococcus durrellii]|uniref:competence type IV pilus major pilin ComGC n=1 Tax=Staphylococcus durrellii TaxID=2781773 RepID=UPI00189E4B7A|nr:competence type IV pilus major pilin ComGC [Staphylococcus durrellii]MBF7017022.1 prepilin-type N-terminal cleavage/methylation domain-containing protein [Staphylococcus durrellii]